MTRACSHFDLLLLSGASFLVASPALAQVAGESEIIVTAQRYETRLVDTPIAINVLDSDMLEAGNIDSSTELQLHVPGLVFSTNIIQGQTYLRGIGTDISSIAADPSVAYIVDGVYMPRLSTALQDLYDVNRVEVVKGPQGTLYGRNATGGVISIVSNRPIDTFEGQADVLLGDYNQQRYRVSLNAPLSNDVAFRGSLMRRSRDGFAVNPLSGNSIDDVDDWAGRGAILFDGPIQALISADASQSRGAPASAVRIISATAPAIAFGGTVLADPYQINQNFPNEVDNDQSGLSANLSWRWGEIDVQSITAFRQSEFRLVLDLDGTEANWFVHNPDTQNSETLSQEIQLSSRSDRLEWVAGAFYFREDSDSSYALSLPLVGVSIRPDATNYTTAYAIFGQGTYSLTDMLRLTLGLRYSHETKESTVDFFANGALAGSFAGEESWDALTPRVGLEVHPSDDMMLFASATRGFKSGGFNSTALQTPQGFNPEFVWSYEAGFKSTFLNSRTRFGATVFRYDYTDLQVNKYDAVNIVTLENAASAIVNGLELEVATQPTDGWNVSSAVTFLDGTYDDFLSVDPDNGPAGLQNLAGNQMVRTPKTSFTFSTDYTLAVGSALELTLRGSYYYRSRVYFTPFNSGEVSQGGFGIVNLSADLTPMDGPWRASVFGKNVTDEFHYQEIARSANIVGTIGWPADPRTWGVEVGFRF